MCVPAFPWIPLHLVVFSCPSADSVLLSRIPRLDPAQHCTSLACAAFPRKTVDELVPAEEPSGRTNRSELGWWKKVRSPGILLPSKTENPYVNTRHSPHAGSCTEWWKLISLTRPRDAYPHFLANKPEIEALLRAGHTMHRVWEAYRQASPPFPATYETFRTYCGKHGLSGLRNLPITAGPPEATRIEAAPAKSSPPSVKVPASPQVWPRIQGKPRQFIPRMEDD